MSNIPSLQSFINVGGITEDKEVLEFLKENSVQFSEANTEDLKVSRNKNLP